MHRTGRVIFIVVIAVILTASLSIVGTLGVFTMVEFDNGRTRLVFDSSAVDRDDVEKFNEVRKLLKEKYIGEVDESTLFEGSIAGMVASLGDPYTMYVDKELMELTSADSEGEYSGIGVTITIPKTGIGILIIDVNELGPAYAEGMEAGDRVISVDGEDVRYSSDLNYVAGIVRGEVGSEVEIEVLRDNNGETETLVFNITRQIVNSVDVEGEMKEEDIGYIRIRSFTQDSPSEFADIYNDLANDGMQSFIIDVRDNPGGSLYAILNIADMIMEEGVITYTVDKNEDKEYFRATRGGVDIPIAILINGYSASASEMLAGALRDNGLATVIGTTSFGKGLVQGVYNLEDGSGVRITIAKYYTPADVCIQDIGIEPDIVVELDSEYDDDLVTEVPEEDDLQLKKAIETLSEQR
jgi:carboxyl-terminal processing protease